jgi:hypothetical protein
MKAEAEAEKMGDSAGQGLKDEGGFILVTAIVVLLLLVIIGIAATTTTHIELQMAGAHKTHTMSFYDAEAGRSFAYASPELYGSTNVVVGESAPFEAPAGFEFEGTVAYDGGGPLPRGSGFSDDYTAHYYIIESTGAVPAAGAEATVVARGYRVGF